MTITTIASAIAVALASFVPASCHTLTTTKSTPAKVAANSQSETNNLAALPNNNGTNCVLGDLTLTNHIETCVKIGQNKQCFFTTRMLDSRTQALADAASTTAQATTP